MKRTTRDVLLSLGAVAALALLGFEGSRLEAGRAALAAFVPYVAFAALLAGFCWRVLAWARVPVPFHIPVSCGQQCSLRWIRAAKIDNPSTRWGVAARMAGEVFLFRSLFRNQRARMTGSRLILGDCRLLWLGALAFHWALLVILLRHLRLFIEPVPAFVNSLERIDGVFQLGAPPLYLSDLILLGALVYWAVRRFRDPVLRYISLSTDYFALFLLLGIATSGMWMRYFARVDILSVKEYALSITALHPAIPQSLGPLFFAHLALVSALAVYLPFSKLMHMGGIFLSPTRNLANDSRARRHVNPWNIPVNTHTYAEWEDEFRDKLQGAGIPLEAEDAEHAHSN